MIPIPSYKRIELQFIKYKKRSLMHYLCHTYLDMSDIIPSLKENLIKRLKGHPKWTSASGNSYS